MRVARTNGPKPNGRIMLTMFTIRTTEPFDWAALLRLFKMDVVERRDGDRVYYRWKDTPLGPEVFFYRPDDRTVVYTGEAFPAEAEKRLLKHIRHETPPPAPRLRTGRTGTGPSAASRSSPSTTAGVAWRSPSGGTDRLMMTYPPSCP